MRTPTHEGVPTRAALEERARWLASLAPPERERLVDVSLREVDRLFEAWRAERRISG